MPAGGKFTIGSGGKLGLRASGGFDVCDDCCGNNDCQSISSADTTLAGFDSTICDGCVADIPETHSNRWTNLNIDGTYSAIPRDTSTPSACTYSDTDTSTSPYFGVAEDFNVGDCSGSPDVTVNYDQLIYAFTYDNTNNRFSDVIIYINSTGAARSHTLFTYTQSTHGGSYDYGDAIPKSRTSCLTSPRSGGRLDIPSTGGTVTINIP